MKAKTKIVIAALAAILPCTACTPVTQPDPRGLTALVSVEGSNTMTMLVQDWAKAFMKTNADVPISVTAGDSGSGIAALISKTTDLAAASRDLTPQEEQLAAQNGEHLRRVTVARDAIVIIVNPQNPVSALTLEQLKGIFSGTKSSWRDVGGPNKPIVVFNREKESGTFAYMQQHVLQGQPYASSAKTLRSSHAITQAIERNPWCIAYEGLGYGTAAQGKLKLIKIKLADTAPAVEPTQQTCVDAYPLSRPLFVFFDKNSKPTVQRFVNFCLSDEGQKIVENAGYVRIR